MQVHAAVVTVNMSATQFTPQTITINAGDTVKWVNNSTVKHTVTSDNAYFDSGEMNPGESFQATFSQAGTFAYHCELHSGMTGTVKVVAAGTSNTTTGTTNTSTNTTTTGNNTQLQAQAQELLARVQALQAQYGYTNATAPAGGTVYDSSSCPLIGRSLKLGASGDDVTRLQAFLARDRSIYPEGIVSGYYGALTQTAVQRWQIKYNVVSSGTPESTGFGVVGPRTAAAISLLCTTGQGGGGSGGSSGAAGGVLDVTPVTGAAPLAVSINVTVNTTNSCNASMYILDYGDGTRNETINVPQGACGPSTLTFNHRYLRNGIFVMKLSSGVHSTTRTISVSRDSGSADTISASPKSGAAPLSVTFTGVVNTTGTCSNAPYSIKLGDGTTVQLGQANSAQGRSGTCQPLSYTVTHEYTKSGTFKVELMRDGNTVDDTSISVTGTGTGDSPVGSINAFVTSGAAPLATTFYVSCNAGVAYNVVFGDGSDLGGQGVSQTACGGLQSVTHTYTAAGSYNAQLVVFSKQSNGTFAPKTVGNVGITVTGASAFNANPSSGNAPLAVTFSGTMPGGNYTLDFGDGSTPVSRTTSTVNETHTYTANGTYTAKLTASGQTARTTTVTVGSGSGGGGGGYTFNPPIPSTGQGFGAFSLQFDLPSTCAGFDLSWGDNSAHVTQAQGSCSQSPIVRTENHTYSQSGVYTVLLKRGTNLSRTDDVSITITQ